MEKYNWMPTLVTKRCNISYIVTNEWNLGVLQGLGQILPLFQTSITNFEYPSQLGSEKQVYKNNSPYNIQQSDLINTCLIMQSRNGSS